MTDLREGGGGGEGKRCQEEGKEFKEKWVPTALMFAFKLLGS
jgi:hypothetical protein